MAADCWQRAILIDEGQCLVLLDKAWRDKVGTDKILNPGSLAEHARSLMMANKVSGCRRTILLMH